MLVPLATPYRSDSIHAMTTSGGFLSLRILFTSSVPVEETPGSDASFAARSL